MQDEITRMINESGDRIEAVGGKIIGGLSKMLHKLRKKKSKRLHKRWS